MVLLDVSRTGARIEGRDLPDVGKDIVLRSGNLDTFGIIAWAAANRRGIQFDEPLNAWDVAALAERSQAIESSAMNAEEMRAAADWANGLAR